MRDDLVVIVAGYSEEMGRVSRLESWTELSISEDNYVPGLFRTMNCTRSF